jgi:tRNA 2-thiouridine synthesizing protein A
MPVIHQTLDARGLKCPLPILLARKALRGLAGGAVLELLATDRGVDSDVLDLCDITGATLLEASLSDGVHRFLLRATGQSAAPVVREE